jgi:hypothetical protein
MMTTMNPKITSPAKRLVKNIARPRWRHRFRAPSGNAMGKIFVALRDRLVMILLAERSAETFSVSGHTPRLTGARIVYLI